MELAIDTIVHCIRRVHQLMNTAKLLNKKLIVSKRYF